VHEKLVRPEHVPTEKASAARRAAPGRAAALCALEPLAFPLPLAHLANLRAQALAFGTPLDAQAFALEALARPGFALGFARCEPRLSGGFASLALRLLGSLFRASANRSHAMARFGKLRLHDLTGELQEFSDQSVDQTTSSTLDGIHHVPFRVSHGTTAVVKRKRIREL